MSKRYKQIALNALRGNWKTAVLAYFVASLFGATVTSNSSSFNFRYSEEYPIEDLYGMFGLNLEVILSVLAVVCVVFGIAVLICGGAVRLGYASFNLNLIDHKDAKFPDLFSQMNRKWRGFCMNFFIGLYIFLWSLLLVIPGIVKSFAYAMTPYILAEHPEMSANDAIGESQFIMEGHKWKLFCLHLSFIGWGILAALPPLVVLLPTIFAQASIEKLFIAILVSVPLSAGYLFLIPYIEAAQAAFYRELCPKQEEPAAEWYLPE